MEGPHDPQHPGQDAGAPQPEAQDGDLHALLERLLGQGDVRPSAPGAADDLWPDVFAAAPVADEVSTIVPAPDAPAALADIPAAVEEMAAEAGTDAGLPLAAALEWEPAVVDVPAATTSIDDIHAAILASVSVDLEPIAQARPDPEPELDLSRYLVVEPEPAAPLHPEPPSLDALLEAALSMDAPASDHSIEPLAAEPTFDEIMAAFQPAATVVDEPAIAAFTLTPFDATGAGAVDPDAAEPQQDGDALWAAAAPELGLDVAPMLE